MIKHSDKQKTAFEQLSKLVGNFIGVRQGLVIRQAISGDEGEWFADKVKEIFELVNTMPRIYQQDGKGDDAVVYLHYFKGGVDLYVTERDETWLQFQAFGLSNLGYGAELGYINIKEAVDCGMELDLHWNQKSLREVKT